MVLTLNGFFWLFFGSIWYLLSVYMVYITLKFKMERRLKLLLDNIYEHIDDQCKTCQYKEEALNGGCKSTTDRCVSEEQVQECIDKNRDEESLQNLGTNGSRIQ